MTDTTKQAELPERLFTQRSITGSMVTIGYKINPDRPVIAEYIRADLVKPMQARPVAWINNSALHTLKIGLADLATVSPQETQMFANALYLHPAPALTAELKAELIECLKMGLTAQMYVHGTERKSPNFIKEVYFERQDKIQAAITKLTNL